MNKQTIITADDHPLLLKGLNDLLFEKNYNIIGSAHNGQEAYNLIIDKKPNIAILDIQMPFMSGIEIARKCRIHAPETKVIFITLYKEKELYDQAQHLNINGYILKEFALEEIETCLEQVAKGEHYYSPKLQELLGVTSGEDTILDVLTPSERKILRLIASDKTNKEIASLLFISYRTVEKHRSNMIVKLQLEPKTNSLLIWAKEHHQRLR
ncbi:MAG: DNA-binding NarL/FixJ family response regulator [Patiriisocius sp.]|jgi:DNA-binding NarL/FixJ family response regulator